MDYVITIEGWLFYGHKKWHQSDVPEDIIKKCIEEAEDMICELRDDLEFFNNCGKKK